MRGFAGFYKRAGSCSTAGIEGDGDNREIEVLEFVVQRLPPGQVK
jgi:hypothetical protein